MYKSKFVMLLVGLLVTSVAFFGFGDTNQVGDDFFDSSWDLIIEDHVGYFSSEFGRDFGSHQWSARIEGFSEQADDNQFDEFYGLNGRWGSHLETDNRANITQGNERFVFLDMGSNARSSLSQTIWMGPKVHQSTVNEEPVLSDLFDAGFDENYKLYLYTNVAGDKGVYSRYDAGLIYEDSVAGGGGRWYGGIATPRGGYEGQTSLNLKLLGEGPNSEVAYSAVVFKDNGPHGYVPVADSSVLGTASLGAAILSGTVGAQQDREALVGAYLGPNGAVVSKIETDEGTLLHRAFVASGTGKLTVTGSGRSDLHALIYPGPGQPTNMIGIPANSVQSSYQLPGADYTYFKAQAEVGFSVGDTGNVTWSFEGGGNE